MAEQHHPDVESEVYRMQAEFCKAMAHPKRMLVLEILKTGERSVNETAKLAGISQANLSQHLGVMRRQGLLRIRREGPNIYYSISDKRIIRACDIVRQSIRERIKRTQQLFQEPLLPSHTSTGWRTENCQQSGC